MTGNRRSRLKLLVPWVAATVVLVAPACADSGEKSAKQSVPNDVSDDSTANTGAGGSVSPRTEGPPAHTESAAPAPPTDDTPDPAQDSGFVVTAIDITPAVARGATATAVFRSRPGSACQMELRPTAADASGQRLEPAVSNASGEVSWSWAVSPELTPGPATAYVVCSGGSRGEATITIS